MLCSEHADSGACNYRGVRKRFFWHESGVWSLEPESGGNEKKRVDFIPLDILVRIFVCSEFVGAAFMETFN